MSLSAQSAEALAEALAKAGIHNDEPEPLPDPFEAAKTAYFTCDPYRRLSDWLDLKRAVLKREFPRKLFYQKLAAWCQAARSDPRLSEADVDAVTFAWGYFSAMATDGFRKVVATGD